MYSVSLRPKHDFSVFTFNPDFKFSVRLSIGTLDDPRSHFIDN